MWRARPGSGSSTPTTRGALAEHDALIEFLAERHGGQVVRPRGEGDSRFCVRVRELRGEERARWWERAVAAHPPYADYQRKTERRIPVFLASRAK